MDHERSETMIRRSFVLALLALLLTLSAQPVAAAPGKPPWTTPSMCSWNGQLYPHGSLRAAPVVWMGKVIRVDYYRCANGVWVYDHSSDD
jgi:hypothetical protein